MKNGESMRLCTKDALLGGNEPKNVSWGLVLGTLILATSAQAQPPSFGRGFGGPGGGPPGRQEKKLVEEFDTDNDGLLDATERAAARAHVKSQGSERRSFGRRGGGAEPTPGKKIRPGDVTLHPDADFYDLNVLRTVFLEFETEDWEAEMADFYRSDVTVPATMTIDGKTYSDVGVAFRGNSSFFTVGSGQKRSFNISVNAKHKKQRVHGYRTLNLLNAHADPSFVRETLFTSIARNYLPTYKANLIRVVINGENWGVYVNSQQFNSDFSKDFFGERDGARWKFSPGRSSTSGTLVYAGPDKESYGGAELKTPEVKDAWKNFVELCRRLDETPTEKLDTDLDDILNVDRALWFIALDNLFIDGDGYLSRASDYTIYQDSNARFHMLHYDSNETFRNAGGGGPGVRLPTDGAGTFLDPFVFATDETRHLGDRPLVRLLDNDRLRQRYAAHVRTILDDWIGWGQVGPVYNKLVTLIDEDIKEDTRKLYSYEDFANGGGGERGAPTIQEFIDGRQLYLYLHPELDKPAPKINSLSATQDGSQPTVARIQVTLGSETPADKVLVYFQTKRNRPFKPLELKERKTQNGHVVFVGTLPPQSIGTLVRYYAEAVGSQAVRFFPSNTETGAHSIRIAAPVAKQQSPVVINEVLAVNTKTTTDEDGDFDDYIELVNRSASDFDLSGYYLSDNPDKPKKWQLPKGTSVPAGGYLLIWADGNKKSKKGLHASFKLDKTGETIVLCDRDERDNQVLDRVTFAAAKPDLAHCRVPDGAGPFVERAASPNAAN